MSRKTYQVTITVDVWDEEALKLAAEARAKVENFTASSLQEWRDIRDGDSDPTSANLVMVFDPGISPGGTEIQETVVELLEEKDD